MKKQFERDDKGDIKIDYGRIDREAMRKARFTYIFHYYDEIKAHHFPSFGLFSTVDERMNEAKQDPEFYEKQLYWTPDRPPYDLSLIHI